MADDPSSGVSRGTGPLLQLLAERTDDFRALGPASFAAWLERRLERWRLDPVFAQRSRIRDLRLEHPRLAELEREERRARGAYEASAVFARLESLAREVADAGKAMDGLGGAMEGTDPERRAELERKRAGFEARRAAAAEEWEALSGGSSERRALLRAAARLAALRRETGLEAEEARLDELQGGRGRGTGRAGRSFEEVALAVTREHLLPELEPEAGGGLVVLRGVGLGAARTEIDQLVVRPGADPERPVEVLAMVEAKRNPNDIAHGFRQRQENLAWLTDDASGYDPADYRTRSFPTGRFDPPAHHVEGHRSYRFESSSFRRFRRDPGTGWFVDGLHFVSRPRTLLGLSSADLARLAHRAATDPRGSPSDPASLAELLDWTLALTNDLEAPDVLRLYGSSEARARQIAWVGRAGDR